MAHYLLGDYDAAEKAASHALNFRLHLILAISYAQAGRGDEAKKHAEAALALNPNFIMQSFIATRPYRREADLEKVIEGMRRVGLPE